MSITAQILDLARQKSFKLAAAESCSGGLIAVALTDLPGSSETFDRGFVTYSNAAKQEMLGVGTGTLAEYGAVSEEVAREMAEGALEHSAADIAVAVTGIAGPGGSKVKPEGRVCFGLARRNGATRVETVDFGPLGRNAVRHATRDHALALILIALREA
ncbi:CinA family protein [Phaeovulum sp. W22_SRMD_FR3]|uniref:CinA family protein n=1 Tax=Phaeovulum sp. W22_SRMD_FR3 TaxID=3240274 RepID=UPI003F99AF40